MDNGNQIIIMNISEHFYLSKRLLTQEWKIDPVQFKGVFKQGPFLFV